MTGVLAAALAAGPVLAGPARLCEAAAAAAARESGVPLPILIAILGVETGGGPGAGAGWPWALNAGGRGRFLPDRARAEEELARLRAGGETSIDVGCFQINLRWHGAAYGDARALLDPLTNARHAAAYLRGLHAETGDWRRAAGRYHSRDPARAEAYVRRMEAVHAATGPARDMPAAAPPPAPRATAGGPLIRLDRRLPPLIGDPA